MAVSSTVVTGTNSTELETNVDSAIGSATAANTKVIPIDYSKIDPKVLAVLVIIFS